MNGDSTIGSMSHRNLTRTRRAVEAVEAAVFPAGTAAVAGASVQFLARAKVTTAVPSGSFDDPNLDGRAQMCRYDGASWVAFGDPVVVCNDNSMPAPLPVGRAVKLGWINGKWWLVSASCA